MPPEKKARKARGKKKPVEFSYSKWAHAGVPMLISGGDDTKLFAYSVKEFSKFSPHDICPAPQHPPIKLALNTSMNGSPLILSQHSSWLDISLVQLHSGASLMPLAQIKSKGSHRIIASALSNSGSLLAYSDCTKPSLFELRKCKSSSGGCSVLKRKLPPRLPAAHSMVFSADSSRFVLSGHDRKIYVSS